MENNEFGAKKTKTLVDESDVGQYKILYALSGQSFGGKIKNLEDGIVTINPLSIVGYKKGGRRKWALQEKDNKLDTHQVYDVEDTTREELENWCEYQNKKEEEEEKKILKNQVIK